MNNTEKRLLTAEELLERREINGAIKLLKQIADSQTDWDSIGKLNGIQESYHYLCHYFMEGTPDPSRGEMLADLSTQLRAVGDRLARRSHLDEQGAYYASIRMADIRHYDLQELLRNYKSLMARVVLAESAGSVPADLSSQRYELLDEIFTAAMVSFQDRNAIRAIKQIFQDPDADSVLKVQLLSAMTLGLLSWFEADSIGFLLDLAGDETQANDVRARAYAALTFALIAHGNRIAQNRTLTQRLELLSDSEQAIRELRTAVKAIAGTRDTKRISDKMANEVIPEIMKLRPGIMSKIEEMGTDFDPESIGNNPEWEKMLEESGLTHKLEELQEMQSDGADLMMVTFSNLKNFHFFHNINNWFLPFDSHNPLLRITAEDSQMLDDLTRFTPFICDSDKYSLALALAQAPANQRKLFSSQFDAQFRQMSEEMRDKIQSADRADFNREAVKAIRDMYRYLMLGRNVNGFFNPFNATLDFTTFPVIGPKLADAEFLHTMSEFYMKREYYTDALALFMHIADSNPADSSVWQKIGFCRQKNKDYTGAREAYMKSELLGDDSDWIVRKLAFVNKKTGHYRSAYDYYDRLLQKDPENMSLLLNSARTALAAGMTAEALAHLYHADYLQPDNIEIKRSIAWATMQNGELDKSENLYSAILLDQPSTGDWLNAGHAAQLRGQYRTALSRYNNAAQDGRDDFALAYNADIPMLERLGADPDGIRILLDEVLK